VLRSPFHVSTGLLRPALPQFTQLVEGQTVVWESECVLGGDRTAGIVVVVCRDFAEMSNEESGR